MTTVIVSGAPRGMEFQIRPLGSEYGTKVISAYNSQDEGVATSIRRKVAPKSVDTDRHPASVSTAGFNRPAVQKNIRGIPGLRPKRAGDGFAAGYLAALDAAEGGDQEGNQQE